MNMNENWTKKEVGNAGYQKCYFSVAGAEVEIPAGLDHKQGWGITNSPNHLKLPISCGWLEAFGFH